MTNPVAMVRKIKDGDFRYDAIMLWCPGCIEYTPDGIRGGLNMLPVSGDDAQRPTWSWNGDLVNVTLSPSILCQIKLPELNFVCHSFLTDGVWNFLTDSTHEFSGKQVPMLELPDWCIKEAKE